MHIIYSNLKGILIFYFDNYSDGHGFCDGDGSGKGYCYGYWGGSGSGGGDSLNGDFDKQYVNSAYTCCGYGDGDDDGNGKIETQFFLHEDFE